MRNQYIIKIFKNHIDFISYIWIQMSEIEIQNKREKSTIKKPEIVQAFKKSKLFIIISLKMEKYLEINKMLKDTLIEYLMSN